MRVEGEWEPGQDGVPRPSVKAFVQTAGGGWVEVSFLVDTGADRTVFSAELLGRLGGDVRTAVKNLGGVGGETATVFLHTCLRLTSVAGGPVNFRAEFAAFPDPLALDQPVLGRDVLNVFTVVVDRPRRAVCLLHGAEVYPSA